MKNQITENNYQNAKKRAKEFYKTIGRLWCPVLNDYVVFNNVGFQHLIRKGHRPRLMSDQTRRFYLLESAEDILTNMKAKVAFEEKNIISAPNKTDKKSSVQSRVIFWKISARQNEKTIIVVVRQIASKQKHFFSIYDQKTARQ
jgi:hypothetical protein